MIEKIRDTFAEAGLSGFSFEQRDGYTVCRGERGVVLVEHLAPEPNLRAAALFAADTYLHNSAAIGA